MDEDGRIADVEDVPEDGTLLFTVRDGVDEREAILIRLSGGARSEETGAVADDAIADDTAADRQAPGDDGDATGATVGEVAAWLNYCQHWTDVRLDRGDGGLIRNDEIVCKKHGATFRTSDGYCTYGPCEGASLEEVAVAVDDGGVYLVDDRFEFVEIGPCEDRDLSSGRSLGFGG